VGSSKRWTRILVTVATAAPFAVAVPQLVRAAQDTHAGSAGTSTGRSVTPSGTDASCPAASSCAAASATVSSPVEAREIGGSESATVIWCPPASGAGSDVSYTVTSSGGQQLTAAVPNDWAIVDGLTDGTTYTFTVTANTKSGTGPAATTCAVTPAAIAEPTYFFDWDYHSVADE
jgi:hypothetical protein